MAWQYWTDAPRHGSWHEVPAPQVNAADHLRIKTTATAVSKGTETLVHNGDVPARIAGQMRAPHQLGDFPFPVSYGYLAVVVVDHGDSDWLAHRVSGLLTHHAHHAVPDTDVAPIPDGSPE